MKKIISIIILLVIVMGFGKIFIALAEIPSVEFTKTYLNEKEGEVLYKKSGIGEWQEIKVGTELFTDDIIKTGNDSFASIIFYDNSSSRLDANTELILEDLENSNKQIINLRLLAGRVWSRVTKLLDADSQFEVRTSSTIATVRGTVFNVELNTAGEVSVLVDENIVEVKSVKTNIEKNPENKKQIYKIVKELNKINVQEGKMVKMELIKDEKGDNVESKIMKIEDINSQIKQGKWFLKNKDKDVEFKKFIKEKELSKIKKQAGILPGYKLYPIKKLAEKVSVAVTLDPINKAKKELSFNKRRLQEAEILMEEKQAKLADKTKKEFFNGLENKIKQVENIDSKYKKEFLKEIDNNFNYYQGFLEKLDKESGQNNQYIDLYNLEEKLLEKKEQVLDPNEVINQKLESINLNYKKVKELIDSGKIQEANILIQNIDHQFDNIKIETLNSSHDKENLMKLYDNIQSYRLLIKEKKDTLSQQPQVLQEKITEPIKAPEILMKDNTDQASDDLKEAEEQLDKNINIINEPITEQKEIISINIGAPRTNLPAGEGIQCFAKAILSSGENIDITQDVQWFASGDTITGENIANITDSGFLQTVSPGGVLEVTAKYIKDGKIFVDKMEITALSIKF